MYDVMTFTIPYFVYQHLHNTAIKHPQNCKYIHPSLVCMQTGVLSTLGDAKLTSTAAISAQLSIIHIHSYSVCVPRCG